MKRLVLDVPAQWGAFTTIAYDLLFTANMFFDAPAYGQHMHYVGYPEYLHRFIAGTTLTEQFWI